MDDYSSSIDWDKIYGAFHDPRRIADRISAELEDNSAPLIFCGFPEVASYLSAKLSVQFVDYSPVITARSRERYSNIQHIVDGEISDILARDSTENIVISCRLSAFWQSQKAIDRLACALLSCPRKQVLIDFFDRDAVCTGQRTRYESKAGNGRWDFEAFEDLPLSNPSVQIATINICYAVGPTRFSYEARRSFFNKSTIESWCRETFVNYTTVIAGPLLHDDPSFLVKLTRR